MGFFTYFLRDMEQILFPNREQHAIPSMDGALSPNNRLDACSSIGEPVPGADDVVEGSDGALYVSGSGQVLRLAGEGYNERSVFATFDGNAGGLAFHPDGRLLVCVAGRGLAAVDGAGRQSWLNQVADQPLNCLTGVVAGGDGSIFVSNGSSREFAGRLVHRPDAEESARTPRCLWAGARPDGGAARWFALSPRPGDWRRWPESLVYRELEPPAEPGRRCRGVGSAR